MWYGDRGHVDVFANSVTSTVCVDVYYSGCLLMLEMLQHKMRELLCVLS